MTYRRAGQEKRWPNETERAALIESTVRQISRASTLIGIALRGYGLRAIDSPDPESLLRVMRETQSLSQAPPLGDASFTAPYQIGVSALLS